MGMNPEIKQQWVAALRSGEYKQGDAYLRQGDSFCCLGVLCDVAVKAGLNVHVKSSAVSTLYDGHSAFLPDSVQDWAGLASCDPRAGNMELSTRNDTGSTFEEIADLIDEYL